ncbi:hypothetical protein ONS96_012782 [Cadophora gregata f. sp. sojae]|nr:hypothetical protein ONS96_012782 [Cadophora gregata f. sp. sojae]
MADGLNDQRTARVADLLSDFRTLQYYIAAAPLDPEDPDDYYTEGYAALRQCSIDGQHILNCAAETRVPRVRGGPEEQAKAELQQVMLDAYARRHEAQKIYLRQGAAQRWIGWRDQVLQGERPHTGHTDQLAACDAQLRVVSSRNGFYPLRSLVTGQLGKNPWVPEARSLGSAPAIQHGLKSLLALFKQ